VNSTIAPRPSGNFASRSKTMRGHADKCSVLRSGLLPPFQSWFLGEFLILFGCSIGEQVLDSNSGRLSTELGSETNAVFQRFERRHCVRFVTSFATVSKCRVDEV
jgi:hypothetical protein